MPKADANITVGADATAFITQMAGLEKGIVTQMDNIGKAELTELSNKGVPIYEALAEVMGKSRDEVVKLGNEGKVSCSDYLAALEKLTDEGGRYHQTNSKMSNTTKGSWDTLKASITECMAALGEPMNDTLRPVLQDLATWIQNNKEEITAVGKGIYASMQQDGELPKAGVIKGPIYQKFVERMQKGDELNRVQGMSEAECGRFAGRASSPR